MCVYIYIYIYIDTHICVCMYMYIYIYIYIDYQRYIFTMSESSFQAQLSAAEVDKRIAERIEGELLFLDGISYGGLFALSKVIYI